MNAIGWNCRGLGNSRAVRVLGDLVKSHKPTILFLSETFSDKKRIERLCSKLGYDNYWSVNSCGRSGGLALFWNNKVQCNVVDSDSNFIDVHVLRNNIPVWRFTGFYGYPERARRRESWELLKRLAGNSALPWCILGDYNDMLCESDKKGVHQRPQSLMDGFKRTIEECQLVELELMGGKFTWEKSRGTKDWVRERIDRAFATAAWWQLFPMCKLTVLHTTYSDHDPIQLDFFSIDHTKKNFRFRFENTWLKEKVFHEEVLAYWQNLSPQHFLPKLIELSSFMEKWGRKFFNKFREKIRKQKEMLSRFEACADETQTKRYFEERGKLEELLEHEEAYWKQRAKSFWLADGDANTKYFHAYATTRKKSNLVTHLVNEIGDTVTEHEGMCDIVREYFQKLFSQNEGVGNGQLDTFEPVISDDQNRKLTEEFTIEEFSRAIKQMHPDKSAGPDGLNPAFYQHFWQMLGKEVFQSCKRWLDEVTFPANLNDTTIVLIPKKNNADNMKDLRPIALCNVLYKIIAKVLSNRLKDLLPGIISENQSAFVPNRSITDNVLIAFEMLHYMKQKKGGIEGEVALKLDVSKAYDRVDWTFLKHQMLSMGFSEKWIGWIMLCVTTVSYSVNFNNSQVGPIQPFRGLRQGDPLSPYLFLICVEGLSRSLQRSAEMGKFSGCRIHAHSPTITHLLFADDSFLFCKAKMEEVREVKAVLEKYEAHSGQAINFLKSGIYFSANVRVDKQLEIKNYLNIRNDLTEGRYLGLPSLIGRSKKRVFSFLKDKLWSKIQGWSAKCLSKGGKAVLLRNVAQAVPSYAMSCFLLPKSLCTELERMMNSFWWGSKDNNGKGIKWLSWTNMSSSKKQGGLGFRDLHGFNLALLGKHVWNFVNNPDSLVARVFKGRYFADSTLFEAQRGGGVSFIWSGLWQAKEALKKGFKWVIGDGEHTRVYKDPWLRGKENFMVDSTDGQINREAKVSELLVPGERRWDVQKVTNLFSDCDANLILAIPIPRVQVADHLAWAHAIDGKYLVKSGYKFWYNNFSGGVHNSMHKGWTNLWNLQVPLKIKVFLWRLCRNNIPVRHVLRGRGVIIPIGCPMCGHDIEHLFHLFLDCKFAESCWRVAGHVPESLSADSCPGWVLDYLASECQDKLVHMAAVLWGIWGARNMKVWEQKVVSPVLAVQWSMKQITQWQEAQALKCRSMGGRARGRVQGFTRWAAPSEGRFKINVDASVKAGHSDFSVGMVLRDHNGGFCRARVLCCRGEIAVLEAETRGVLEALQWAYNLGISDVLIETDSLLTVQAINSRAANFLEIGHLFKECQRLLSVRPDLSVSYVKKQANTVAHVLARVPCDVGCFCDFESPPRSVLENLMYDVSSI